MATKVTLIRPDGFEIVYDNVDSVVVPAPPFAFAQPPGGLSSSSMIPEVKNLSFTTQSGWLVTTNLPFIIMVSP